MELSMCLIVYLITVIVIVLWMYKMNRTIWASLLYGLIFGMIVLLVIQPPSNIDPRTTGMDSWSALYLLIFLITPIYVALYALRAAYYDYNAIIVIKP